MGRGERRVGEEGDGERRSGVRKGIRRGGKGGGEDEKGGVEKKASGVRKGQGKGNLTHLNFANLRALRFSWQLTALDPQTL